jgi:hypothetical protein
MWSLALVAPVSGQEVATGEEQAAATVNDERVAARKILLKLSVPMNYGVHVRWNVGDPTPLPQFANGTLVFADDFVLDSGAGTVEASGNVTMETWKDGEVASTVTADQVTIRRPEPITP